MTDLTFSAAAEPSIAPGIGVFAGGGRIAKISPRLAQSILVCVVLTAAAVGFLATDGAATARAVANAGEDLTRLLRAMAAIKAVMALGAAGAVLWRLGSPIGGVRLAAYAVACAAMAAGPGLIWDMTRLALGASLLHGGLIGVLLLLWRDPEIGRRLSALIAARRAAIATH